MKNLQKGFSLIELLVVVAIISILAAIGSVGYSNYIAKSHSAADSANIQVLQNALLAEDTALQTCQADPITKAVSITSCAAKFTQVPQGACGTGLDLITVTSDSTHAYLTPCVNGVAGTAVTVTLGNNLNAS